MSPSFMDVWTVCLRHRRMSSSRHIAGVTLSNVTGLNWDIWLFGHHEILAWQWAKLLRYGREGAVEVRPFLPRRGYSSLRCKGFQVKQ